MAQDDHPRRENTGKEGKLYELELLMLFFQKALKLQMDFHLGREVPDAGKFDDLVFRYQKNGNRYTRYVQAKHCINEDNLITSAVLFPSRHDPKGSLTDKFHLDKYFTSFIAIQKQHETNRNLGRLQDIIIFTNTDFDYGDLKDAGIRYTTTNDDFIHFPVPQKTAKTLKLGIDPKSRLCSALKYSSDSSRLADEMVNITVADLNDQKRHLGTPNSLSGRYAVPLLDQVLEKSKSKITFQRRFIEASDDLSENAANFRAKLLEVASDKYELPKERFLKLAEGAVLLGTKKFGEERATSELPMDEITDEKVTEFFDCLLFAVSQPNVDQLRDFIGDKELRDSFRCVNTDFIVDSLENRILSWINEKKSREGWIDNKDAEKFFQSAMKMIVSLTVSGMCLPYVRSFLRVSNISENLVGIRSFIKEKNPRENWLKVTSKETFWTCCKLYSLVKNEVEFAEEDSVIFCNSSMLQHPEIAEKTMEAFQRTNTDLLVLECKTKPDKDILNRLISISKEPKKKLILVVGEDAQQGSPVRGAVAVEDGETSFDDLSTESQEDLLAKTVMFQGFPVELNNVFTKSSDAGRILKSRTMARMVREEQIIRICKPVHDQSYFDGEYYIKRVFTHIRQEIIQVYEYPTVGPGEESTRNQKDPPDPASKGKKHNQKHDDDDDDEHDFKTGEHNEHPESGSKSQKIDYHPRQPDNLVIKEFVKIIPEEVEEKDLLLSGDQRLIVVSDTAGMGKSTVLTNLSIRIKQQYPRKWIKKLDLNNYASLLRKSRRKKIESKEEAIRFLWSVFLESRGEKKNEEEEEALEHEMYKYYLEKEEENMIIFFDGLDEICPDYKEIVVCLINALVEETKIGRLVVSTRPNMKVDLENLFKVAAYSMQPFTAKQQVEFLTRFWQKRNPKMSDEERIKDYAETLISKLNECIKDEETKLTGIPLQTKMVAEIFERGKRQDEESEDESESDSEAGEYANTSGVQEYYHSEDKKPTILDDLDLCALYKKFVKKKYWDILEREKFGNDYAKPGLREKVQSSYEGFLDDYKLLALFTLLPQRYEDVLDSVQKKKIEALIDGIKTGKDRNGLVNGIVDGKPQFVHRTFAEYFLVEMIADYFEEGTNIKKLDEFIFTKLLIEEDHKTIRHFLDAKLRALDRTGGMVKDSVESADHLLMQPMSDHENSSVHVAVAENHFYVVEFLDNRFREMIQDVLQYKNANEQEVIHIAVSTGNLKVCQWVVEKGVAVGGKSGLLHSAVQCGSLEVLDYLLTLGVAVEENDSVNRTALHYACRKGYSEMVKSLVSRGSPVNQADGAGKTPFLLAAAAGNVDVLGYLEKEGADITATTDNGDTALYRAADNGNLNAVEFLLKRRENINKKNKQGRAPLHVAAKNGHLKIAQVLLQEGANLDVKCEKGRTPFHLAALHGKLDLVKLLLDSGADIHEKDNDNNTALICAAHSDSVEVLDFLLKNGASLNDETNSSSSIHFASRYGTLQTVKYLHSKGMSLLKRDSDGDRPTACAAYQGNAEIVEYFLDKGADVNDRAPGGHTALLRAVKAGNLETVKVLVSRGAEIDAKNSDGHTALHLAALQDKVDVLKYLYDKAKNDCPDILKERDDDGDTVLLCACNVGALRCVKFIIHNGGDLTDVSTEGNTALHHAAEYGNLDTVRFLLTKGVDVHQRNHKGYTGLLRAVNSGKKDIVEFLLDNGANICDESNGGWTVVMRAVKKKKYETLQFLLERGARAIITKRRKLFKTALQYAAKSGNFDTVKCLVENGVDVNEENELEYSDSRKDNETDLSNAPDSSSRDLPNLLAEESIYCETGLHSTALHYASRFGTLEMVRYLHSKGMSITKTDEDGDTPIMCAAYYGKVDIVEYFLDQGVDVNHVSHNGKIALLRATRQGHVATVKLLISRGAQIEAKTPKKLTAVHLAAFFDRYDLLEYLYEKIKNYHPDIIHQRDDDGDTVLLCACRRSLRCVKYIIDNGGDLNDVSNAGNAALHRAAEFGTLDTVQFLLSKGADIHQRNYKGYTALLRAVNSGKKDIVAFLLDNGANICDESTGGWTAVLRAAKKGKSETLQLLLERGASAIIHKKRKSGMTALQYAAKSGNFETVKCLVENGVVVNEENEPEEQASESRKEYEKDQDTTLSSTSDIVALPNPLSKKPPSLKSESNHRNTALHYACQFGSLQTVKYLESNGMSKFMFTLDEEGDTPVMCAAYGGKVDTVEYFLGKGAGVNDRTAEGQTALMWAARQGHMETVKLLISRGARIDLKNNRDLTALHLAALEDQVDVLEYLYGKAKTDCPDILKERDDDGDTVLLSACSKGALRCLKFLIVNGGDLTDVSTGGDSALHYAAGSGNLNTVRFLLTRGVDIHQRNHKGYTGLLRAVDSGKTDIVKFLLDNGANICDESTGGWTVVLRAAKRGRAKTLQILLERGASAIIHKRRKLNMTALHYAAKFGNAETVRCLVENGLGITAENELEEQPIHHACSGGKSETVEFLLERNADIHKKNHEGMTPIHMAAMLGNLKTVEILFRNGADIHVKDNKDHTPVMLAARNGKTDIIEFLVQNGANLLDKPSYPDFDVFRLALKNGNLESFKYLISKIPFDIHQENSTGDVALHYACVGGKHKTAEYLLENGAHVDKRNEKEQTPLHIAAQHGNLETVKVLLQHGANIHARDSDDEMPLMKAARGWNVRIMTFLVQEGASLHDKNEENFNVFHLALRDGNLKCVNYLISRGFDIHEETEAGNVALHYACAGGKHETVEFLLKNGADVDKRNKQGHTPLHEAAVYGDVKTLGILLQHGAELNAKDSNGGTAMLSAASAGKKDAVAYLVENGSNIHERDNFNCTALHESSRQGHLETVRYLLKNGVGVNEESCYSEQPLHYASAGGKHKVAKLLIENNADIHKKSELGKTPLLFASLHGNVETVELLLSHGADIHDRDYNGWTTLFHAAENDLDVFVYLHKMGSDVRAKCNRNGSPLHIAAEKGNLEVVQYLLENGAGEDVHEKDADGDTPLLCAAASGNVNVIKLLLLNGGSVQDVNCKGCTGLHYAAESGDLEIVKFFIENGIDAYTPDNECLLPVQYASRGGKTEVVDYLLELDDAF